MRSTVFVYEGRGASPLCTKLLLSSLHRCLCPASHHVTTITPHAIKKGGWQEGCAALALGGGYDRGFLQALGTEGAQEIRQFVLQGGAYLGLCSGAYFACDSIAFEKGDPTLQVCGPRPLRFYPGQGIGSVAPNFTYNSERGAAAIPITLTPTTTTTPIITTTTTTTTIPRHKKVDSSTTLHTYVNGGGYFSPSPTPGDFGDVQGVEMLARFSNMEGKPAAVVQCSVGDRGGKALLSGPHIEFSAFELSPTDVYLMRIERELRCSERLREALWCSFLQRAGLTLRRKASL